MRLKEIAAREAEEAAAREAEEAAALAAREAEEAAAVDQPGADGMLRAVVDDVMEDVVDEDEVIDASIEEFGVEDLQAEPEWLEAVEEMTLDDIAEAGDGDGAAAGAVSRGDPSVRRVGDPYGGHRVDSRRRCDRG